MKIAKKLFKYYLLMMVIFFIGRLILWLVYHDRFATVDNSWMSFLYGLKMDTMLASLLMLPPLLILTLSPAFMSKISNAVLRVYFAIVFGFIVYIENATFPFFAEYDVRPNYKFVEYLEYPKEVFSLIMAQYKLPLIVSLIMVIIFVWFFLRYTKDSFTSILSTPLKSRILWLVPLVLLLFIGARSSFGHRPANISSVMYSPNRILNEVNKNSIYSVGYAIYSNKRFSTKAIKLYGKMDANQAMQRVSSRLGISTNDLNSTSPFSRLEATHFKTDKKRNLVIFLQESLGYQFISPEITPELLKLKKEGLWFDQLYSNGTRSVRGIAGTGAGFLSVPGKGVVKRTKSQNDFFTFASLLRKDNYHTMFLYGGEAHFDNMRSWFLGNGVDEIVEGKNFSNPSFVATWGVSDEDLVNLANEKFQALYANKQPFAALMFSSSNHSPFEIPDGKVPVVDSSSKYNVNNAVRYADYAIGRFFADAKKLPYYKDTIFVVIADHNVRVYGDDVVPVNMFHIPALIIGDGVKPQVYSDLSSQPDVLATLLDYMGRDFTYPILGHSIYSDQKQGINLMQFNTNYALRVGNKVAVIRPSKPALTFLYEDEHLVPAAHDQELEKDALAFVITLNHLYSKQLYR